MRILLPSLDQQQHNLHLTKPSEDVLAQWMGQVSGKMTWFPVSTSCWLTNGLASPHFLTLSAVLWKQHAHSPLSPSLFRSLYSSHRGLVCFWCVNAACLFFY